MPKIKGLKVEQVFYRYELWEDFQSGMYNSVDIRDEKVQKCIELFGDPIQCRLYMERVVNEWVTVTKHTLTNPSCDGKSWLGQCACFLYCGSHDEETRKAWCIMSDETRKLANGIAKEVIQNWLIRYAEGEFND